MLNLGNEAYPQEVHQYAEYILKWFGKFIRTNGVKNRTILVPKEVTLNRNLASPLYISLQPVNIDGIRIEAEGEVRYGISIERFTFRGAIIHRTVKPVTPIMLWQNNWVPDTTTQTLILLNGIPIERNLLVLLQKGRVVT